MPESFPKKAAFSKLGDLVGEMAAAPVSEQVHAEGRSRIIAIVNSGVVPRKVLPLGAKVSLSVLAVAAAFALIFWSIARVRPITYEIVGGSGFESGYLSASPERAAIIRFSDGSWINADPGTRLRVEATMKDGARVLLERGAAAIQVHHEKTSNWLFVAGPFEVQVIGTRFTLAWDPAKEEVDLSLEEGAVRLNSPLGRGPFEVRKGQKFHASLASRTIRMEDATGVSSATARVPEAPSALPAEPATEGSADEAPSTPANSAPTPAVKGSNSRQDSWQTLVSRGQFQAVVAAAEARGIDACLQSCGVSDVRALADAARYTGHSSIAEQSLLAIRQRAPAGNQRSAAAFLLGRTSESGGQAASANGWYDNYLAESPNGEFAADALAGKMRVTVQTQGNAAARPLAMQYLQRYPNGVHADIARKIAGIR